MSAETVSGRRWLGALAGMALLAAALAGAPRDGGRAPARDPRAGTIVASIRSEPAGFNPYTAPPAVATDLVTRLLHGSLVQVDPRTDDVTPWLAERLVGAGDNVTYTVTLRPDLVFSDGTPASSEDVVASFRAAADGPGGSYLADRLTIQEKPIAVRAVDARTVEFRFPAPYAPGVRILADIPILPARVLRAAQPLRGLWPSTVSPRDIQGLGPFVLAQYQPGQRLVFERNPRYWRRDADGRQLPYLDRLILEVVADQNTELLRLQAGHLDMTTGVARPEDISLLRRAESAGRLRVHNLGPGLDANALWFNLRPGRAGQIAARWVHADAFRQAISHAIDRRAFADDVYLGLADPLQGPITPANTRWYSAAVPTYSFDVARARQLLAGLGLRDRDGDGWLEDERGAAASFVLFTQAGNTPRERGARFIRDELRRLGIQVDVVPLAVPALLARFESGEYQAMYFGLQQPSTEPADQLDFWLSSGHLHLWHPSQRRPARAWEQEIDSLMEQQVAVTDAAQRKRLFDRAQHVLAAHAPVIYFAAPRIVVVVSSRVRNARPVIVRPHVLWNADTLMVP